MDVYQSALRITIQQKIYGKPSFSITVGEKSYTGFIKRQKKLGKTFSWYMVQGLHLGDVSVYRKDVYEEIHRIRRDWNQSWGDMFFQCACSDVVHALSSTQAKKEETMQHIHTQQTYQDAQFLERYDLQPSRREHMPGATVVLDLRKTLPELKKNFSSSGKRMLNKGVKQELRMEEATVHDREVFRDLWYAMAYDKGFAIISKETFVALMRYLTDTKQGVLLLAKKGKQIVSGSVLLFVEKQLVYLYGATDRSFGPIGGHYRLMYETMRRGRERDFTSLDLLGIAPPGAPKEHPLTGVSRFKHAFGGAVHVYVGSYDLVFNPMLYSAFQMMRRGK